MPGDARIPMMDLMDTCKVCALQHPTNSASVWKFPPCSVESHRHSKFSKLFAILPLLSISDQLYIPSVSSITHVLIFFLSFRSSFQHLSKAVGIVTKSVLEEQLTSVGSSTTCTGSLHGFNRYGHKATFRSLKKIRAPLMMPTPSVSSQFHFMLNSQFHVPICSALRRVQRSTLMNPAPTGSAFKIHSNDENLVMSILLAHVFSLLPLNFLMFYSRRATETLEGMVYMNSSQH